METIPSVDKALRNLFATSTISQDRSVLSPTRFGTPESKIMFTAEWVFSKTHGLAKYGITCSQDLIQYMNCHPQTYVCHENCVLSRELWNVMPCEFDAFMEFANLFRYQCGYNRHYLLAAVQEKEILQIRLKNMKGLRAFLRSFSEFFVIMESGLVGTSISFGSLPPEKVKKIDNMHTMTLIQSFIALGKKVHSGPIKFSMMLEHFSEQGFGFTFQQLADFLSKFNFNVQYDNEETVQPIIESPIKSKTPSDAVKALNDTLKGWPIDLRKIRAALNGHGVILNNPLLRSIIDEYFPDYKIQDGTVVKNHDRHKDIVQRFLNHHCPVSVTELRQAMTLLGFTLSRQYLSEMVVKTLNDYFISKALIFLPDSQTSWGQPMKDYVLDKIHILIEDQCPVSLDDLSLNLTYKGIQITVKKLRAMIMNYSTRYKCEGNFVQVDVGPSRASKPEDVGELVTYLKSLSMNDKNSVIDSDGRRLFKAQFLDEVLGHSEAYQLLRSIIVTKEGIGFAQQPQCQPKQMSDMSLDLNERALLQESKYEPPNGDLVVGLEKQIEEALDAQLHSTPKKQSFEAAATIPEGCEAGVISSFPNVSKVAKVITYPVSNLGESQDCQAIMKENFPEWALYLDEALEITEDIVNLEETEISASGLMEVEPTNLLGEPVPLNTSGHGSVPILDEKKTKVKNDCILS